LPLAGIEEDKSDLLNTCNRIGHHFVQRRWFDDIDTTRIEVRAL
jgi:hypothetical protein